MLYLAKRQRKADQTEEGALFYMTIGLHLVACKDELWAKTKTKTLNFEEIKEWRRMVLIQAFVTKWLLPQRT